MLYKKKAQEKLKDTVVKKNLLGFLIQSESYLMESSSFKDSLLETARRQNIRKGLTNICDSVYCFFVNLDKRLRELESMENLNYHGSKFSKFVLEKLKVDMSLINCWKELFPLSTDEVICHNLLYEILEKYTSMSLAQVTKSYLEQCNVQKKKHTEYK